jgi:lysosomal-associated membrane protein 1/2
VTCIQAQFAIQVVVKYNDTKGKELEGGFVIPKNATVGGNCVGQSDPLEVMIISFTNVGNTSATLKLKFNQTEGNKTFYVEDVELSFNLTKELFPDYVGTYKTVTASNNKADLFSVASAHAYTCATQSVQLETLPDGVKEIQIDFTSSKVAAFMDHTKGQWDSEIDCKSSEISDVVPIAVGAALAGLVVIVLIAYFIGRRRSRRLAYQSV